VRGRRQTRGGQIQSVDPPAKTVTLSDGARLTIPDTLRVGCETLMPGATVKAAYEEKAGERVVTPLEFQPEWR
jgi:uncharacterized protein DUF1344